MFIKIVDRAADLLKEKGEKEPAKYIDFEELLKDKNIEAVYVATSWEDHINQSIRCMEVCIPLGMEVGGACTIKDC